MFSHTGNTGNFIFLCSTILEILEVSIFSIIWYPGNTGNLSCSISCNFSCSIYWDFLEISVVLFSGRAGRGAGDGAGLDRNMEICQHPLSGMLRPKPVTGFIRYSWQCQVICKFILSDAVKKRFLLDVPLAVATARNNWSKKKQKQAPLDVQTHA